MGLQDQKAAVKSGQWLLYRFNPDRTQRGENPLQIDSAPPTLKIAEYLQMENRFRLLPKSNPEQARHYFEQAQGDAERRWNLYQHLAAQPSGDSDVRTERDTA
jgi:pyruvate-ferredoxin/flavodoxin oxidoreductase